MARGPRAAAPVSVAVLSRPPQSRWPRSAARASVRRARGTPVSCQAVCSARKRSSFLVWAGFWVEGASAAPGAGPGARRVVRAARGERGVSEPALAQRGSRERRLRGQRGPGAAGLPRGRGRFPAVPVLRRIGPARGTGASARAVPQTAPGREVLQFCSLFCFLVNT